MSWILPFFMFIISNAAKRYFHSIRGCNYSFYIDFHIATTNNYYPRNQKQNTYLLRLQQQLHCYMQADSWESCKPSNLSYKILFSLRVYTRDKDSNSPQVNITYRATCFVYVYLSFFAIDLHFSAIYPTS